jgi:hypothetical protein
MALQRLLDGIGRFAISDPIAIRHGPGAATGTLWIVSGDAGCCSRAAADQLGFDGGHLAPLV